MERVAARELLKEDDLTLFSIVKNPFSVSSSLLSFFIRKKYNVRFRKNQSKREYKVFH